MVRYPIPTVEYTLSTSPVASASDQTSETTAQAGTDGSVGVDPPGELRGRASDGLGDVQRLKKEQDQVCPAISTF
jgi:hypothetical protein